MGQGRPVVVLAHTVKGWLLGEGFEGSNVTHQRKKFEDNELKASATCSSCLSATRSSMIRRTTTPVPTATRCAT
jgi:hypothetical protein